MLTAAVALLPCAAAKTLYWTGQSSDGESSVWLPVIAWSENKDADIGDCMYTEEDDIVFTSTNVDNVATLTNYDKDSDTFTPVKVHSAIFDSYVEFNVARIELTRDDLVGESINHVDGEDSSGQ